MKTRFINIGLPILLALAMVALVASMLSLKPECVEAQGYSCRVYTEQGCAKFVIANGGELEVQSGGTLDIQDDLVITGGLFLPAFTDLAVSNGDWLTPTTASVYALDSSAAVTITLGACSHDGQELLLVGDDNNTITINDTNIRTSDGNATTVGQYDAVLWVCQDTEWLMVSRTANQ